MASAKPAPSLTPAQQKAIALLASGKSYSATARELGIHRSTLYNWFDNPAFAESYRDASAEEAGRVSDELHELSRLALDTLRQLLTDPKTPPSIRLRASLAVLNHEAPSRHGLWALPFPQPAPRTAPPTPPASVSLPHSTDLDTYTQQLLSQFPAFSPRR